MDNPAEKLDAPLVSIMMATYDRADLIGHAIESIFRQSYQNWELLILDDASTDDTERVVRPYIESDRRVKYFPAPRNLGIVKNRNRAFDLAIGEYMAVLDSDDLWIDSDKLARQVEFLEARADHALVGTQVRVVDADGTTIDHFHYETDDRSIRQKLLRRNQFTHSSVLWRRKGASSELRYDETIPIWEDYDLILHLGKLGKLANLDSEMTAYRKHDGNISKIATRRGAQTHLDMVKRHATDYPNRIPAYIKGILRLIKSTL